MASDLFAKMAGHEYENLYFCYHKESGLKAIIAVHSTALGPAGGGVRMWPYDSEDAAIEDALRLSRAMTYKFAAAGLNMGGGKTVIVGDPKTDKGEALFRALGRFINRLNGLYYAGEDVGTTPEDMAYIAMETPHVSNLPDGSPSPITAYGVLHGMKACVREVFSSDSLAGRTVALQGCGSVGQELIGLLVQEGAKLVVTDIDADKVKETVDRFGVEAVAPDTIYDQEVDVFSPCAMGGIINDNTVPRLKCKIVAGSANNQLREDKHGDMLKARGILYAPDFVINGGGAIYGATRGIGGETNIERIRQRVAGIGQAIAQIIAIAKEENLPTYKAADRLAEKRIAMVRVVKKI